MLAIITFSLIIFAMERDINYWLPDYTIKRSFGLVGFIYMAARIVAPWMIMMGLWSLHIKLVLIWILLYPIANIIKKIAWKLEYWINYKLHFKLDDRKRHERLP